MVDSVSSLGEIPKGPLKRKRKKTKAEALLELARETIDGVVDGRNSRSSQSETELLNVGPTIDDRSHSLGQIPGTELGDQQG